MLRLPLRLGFAVVAAAIFMATAFATGHGQGLGTPSNLSFQGWPGFFGGNRVDPNSLSDDTRVAYVTGVLDGLAWWFQSAQGNFMFHCLGHLSNGQWTQVALSRIHTNPPSLYAGQVYTEINQYCNEHGW